MTITSANIAPPREQNIEITKILEFIKIFFESLHLETKSSEELVKLGIETSLTKVIRDMMEDPMGQLYGNIKNLHQVYFEIQATIINNLLSLGVFKKMSDKIFLEKDTKENLTYHIVLKDNTLENRGKIRKLLNSYNDSEDSYTFPVFLQFLDEETYSQNNKEYSDSKHFLQIES